ncbi:hypothetical protein Nepgr_028436 [Nepenthes gracilis]|uniref:Uncharacterized protein n=1 Tax=Nepenthes gracilis TaxID=150966 RepID=A0AAD3Y2E7_NEPGR|nr:hypothetical protein Nepgr_028436 [Nepenthes gracilis]
MITTELGLGRLKAMNVCKLFSYRSQMAKIHPHMLATSSSPPLPLPLPPASSASSGGETFTVWMKSLVLNGNGFTVYNSRGEIVYRVDNYDTKCKNEVCIMDLKGRVLCTLLKRVKKVRKSFGAGFAWRVTAVACDTIDAQSSCFLMEGS